MGRSAPDEAPLESRSWIWIWARQRATSSEGLDHVIVGAESEPADLVHVVLAGGDHDDGHVFALSHLAADFEAADSRQHHVEQQQRVFLRPRQTQPFAAVEGDLHREAVGFQIVAFQFRNRAVVLHNQDFPHVIPPLSPRRLREF